MDRPPAMTLTDAAVERIKTLLSAADKSVVGLRVGVKAQGCSGMSYYVEYAEKELPFEEKVEDQGVTILIDPAATMFLIGSEMDYREDKLQSGFVFDNPNAKGQCGCGESFHV